LVEERVPGYAAFFDIVVDLREGPGIEGVELEEPGGVDFEGLKGGAGGTLRCTTAGDDGLDVEITVCTAGGLDLTDGEYNG
jgi:hypothetical protein